MFEVGNEVEYKGKTYAIQQIFRNHRKEWFYYVDHILKWVSEKELVEDYPAEKKLQRAWDRVKELQEENKRLRTLIRERDDKTCPKKTPPVNSFHTTSVPSSNGYWKITQDGKTIQEGKF